MSGFEIRPFALSKRGSGDDLTYRAGGVLQTVSSVVDTFGTRRYVDATDGSDTFDGLSKVTAKATVQAAVTDAVTGDIIYIAPGDYDENVTIAVGKPNITLVGIGARNSVEIVCAGATTALTVNANEVTLINIALSGDETAGSIGLLNRGRALRYYEGRILNVETCAKFTLGTPTQVTAGTYGDGSNTLCEDVEFSWATNGIDLVGVTDAGVGDFGTTQNYFRRCTFHNCSAASITETPLGAAAQSFRDLEVSDCIFKRVEAGTEPTKYIDLDGSNSNSGIVTRCSFPTALAGGKNLVSTAVIWVSNYHTGGVSTTVPS